jgi:hypothetical protein
MLLLLFVIQARIITSGSGDWRYVDAVSRKAGKLEALEWVRRMYNVPLKVSELCRIFEMLTYHRE